MCSVEVPTQAGDSCSGCLRALQQVDDLREQLYALVDCCAVRGLLHPQHFHAVLHRRHFARVMLLHPCHLDVTLIDVLALGGVVDLVRRQSNLHTMLQLRGVCAAFRAAVPLEDLRSTSVAKLFVCGGQSNGAVLSSVESLDCDAGTWESAAPMTRGRYGAAAVAARGKLYVCGGNSGLQVLNTVECFDACDSFTASWSTIARMHHPREGAVAVVVRGNHICVAGGGDGNEVLQSVEGFNGESTNLHSLPDMMFRRMRAAAGTIDGKIYTCGGHSGQSCLAAAERFDPSTGIWERLPDMRERREKFGAAVIEGYLYVCGGSDRSNMLDCMERFNPVYDTWEGLVPMPQPCDGLTAGAVARKLFICGGCYGRQDLRTAMRFDPVTGQWLHMESMAYPRIMATAVSIRI